MPTRTSATRSPLVLLLVLGLGIPAAALTFSSHAQEALAIDVRAQHASQGKAKLVRLLIKQTQARPSEKAGPEGGQPEGSGAGSSGAAAMDSEHVAWMQQLCQERPEPGFELLSQCPRLGMLRFTQGLAKAGFGTGAGLLGLVVLFGLRRREGLQPAGTGPAALRTLTSLQKLVCGVLILLLTSYALTAFRPALAPYWPGVVGLGAALLIAWDVLRSPAAVAAPRAGETAPPPNT